ncbi:MAG: hypothetical protein JNM56_00530 [Planctomycetia bacterium]|nr:hypothetical protein [Planctomycetia bacterium]
MLLCLAREGQHKALGDLLQGYRAYLLRIAQDELPAAVHGKVGCFARVQGSTLAELQSWLRTILHRQIGQLTQHFLRTQKRQANREVPSQDQPDAGQETPSSVVGNAGMATFVRQAMERLPEHYRQAVVCAWDRSSAPRTAVANARALSRSAIRTFSLRSTMC